MDEFFLSGERGLQKPEAEIFELVLNHFGLQVHCSHCINLKLSLRTLPMHCSTLATIWRKISRLQCNLEHRGYCTDHTASKRENNQSKESIMFTQSKTSYWEFPKTKFDLPILYCDYFHISWILNKY